MSKFNQLDTPQDSIMKALIIYDDFGSGAKASATLQRVAHRAEVNAQWDIRPWRVDMLKFPPTAEEALTDAADAHLIVFAGRIAQSLPFRLQHWLEHWAKCRQIEDAALAVIGDGTSGERSTPAAPELSLFAARHDLSFIMENETSPDDEAASVFRTLTKGKLPAPPTRNGPNESETQVLLDWLDSQDVYQH